MKKTHMFAIYDADTDELVEEVDIDSGSVEAQPYTGYSREALEKIIHERGMSQEWYVDRLI